MGRELIEAFDRADADDDVRVGDRHRRRARLLRGRRPRRRRRRRSTTRKREARRDGRCRATTGASSRCAIFDSHEARDRRDQRPGGRRRRDDDAADGHPPRRRGRAHGLRVRAPRHRPRGLLELVPAARRRHQPGDGVGRHRPRVLRRRRRSRAASCAACTRSGELLGAARALAREIADNTAPVSVALARQLMWRMLGAEHPMVAHRADSRGDVRARAVRRRGRGRHRRSSRSARRVFPDRVSDGPARHHARVERRPSSSSAQRERASSAICSNAASGLSGSGSPASSA